MYIVNELKCSGARCFIKAQDSTSELYSYITHKEPSKLGADDILNVLFFRESRKIKHEIACESDNSHAVSSLIVSKEIKIYKI